MDTEQGIYRMLYTVQEAKIEMKKTWPLHLLLIEDRTWPTLNFQYLNILNEVYLCAVSSVLDKAENKTIKQIIK